MDLEENQEKKKTRAEKNDASKKKVWIAILIAAAVAICVIVAVYWNLTAPAPQPELSSVVATATPQTTAGANPSALPTEPQMLPEMAELYEQNNDIAGWLRIEGTAVDYPVMYTPEDGEFYLYRTFEKEDDPTKEGCLFIDKNCTVEPRSTNLLIHGHNMKNGTMFHTLLEYQDEAFYREHPVIEYRSLYSADRYEIVAVFLSKVYKKSETDVFKFYQFYDATNEAEFNEYIENCQALSLYDTGVTAEYGDELITLATCEYSQENGRLAVVARKTGEDSVTAKGELQTD